VTDIDDSEAVESNEDVCNRSGDLPFIDVSGSVKATVSTLYFSCLVDGVSPDRFAPNDFMTRAAIVKLAVTAFGHPVNPVATYQPFSDVPTSAWYAPYVIAAREAGIVKGVGGNLFEPDRPVNLVEAVKILLEAAGLDVGEARAVASDVPATEWYAAYVTFAVDNGLMNVKEDGSIGAGDSLLRGNVANMLLKVMGM
jgi:hypothetical protein